MNVLVVGRWQPFHLGHLELVRQAAKFGEVTIVIGSSNKKNTRENPLSFAERKRLIESCLKAERLKAKIIPQRDIGDNEKWVREIERKCRKVGLVISGNDLCRKIFREHGYLVMKPKFLKKYFYKGSAIREKIVAGKNWEKFLHPVVCRMLKQMKFEKRVKVFENPLG